MKENQKSGQVSTTLSSSKSQSDQSNLSGSSKSPSVKDDKTPKGNEIPEKKHEHDYKSPVANPSSKVGSQSGSSSKSQK